MKASFRHFAFIAALLCNTVSGQTVSYTVKPGDSLSKIARSQGCTVEALAKANGIKLSAVIQAGQTLKLPGKAAETASSGGNSHIVQAGDTLSSISRQYNTTVESLQAANPGLEPKSLKPGQKILLSAIGKVSPAKSTPAKTETSQKKSDPPQPVAAPAPPPPATSKPESAVPPASSVKEKPLVPSSEPAPQQAAEEKVHTVVVDAVITFGEFAAQHGSDIKRLNELNGLDLTGATVLAKGSELYVPTQSLPEGEPQR